MNLSSCARLLEQHFSALAITSPQLARWYRKAGRKPKHPAPLQVGSTPELEKLLESGANWTDIPRRPMPELGWSVGAWNGDDGEYAASTSVRCGGYARGMPNSANLDISAELDREAALGLLKALVNVWDADRGVIEFRSVEVAEGGLVFAEYATSLKAILFGRGERFGRGRLTFG
jgi:hypothetical protein